METSDWHRERFALHFLYHLAGLTARATLGAHHPGLQVGSSPHLSCHPQSLSLLLQTLLGWESSAPTARESGKEEDAFGLPLLMAQSMVCRWDPCAICGELVSPSTALQLPEDGAGWHMMCHGHGAGVCRFVCQLCPVSENGGQAVSSRRKDGTDVSGGISGYEERSLLC